jgi:DNA-binding transcriptional ArsR family regulator
MAERGASRPGSNGPGQLDRLVHEPARLSVLLLLRSLDEADFIFLQRETGLTQGNLSSHLATLEEAGYLLARKEFELDGFRVPAASARSCPIVRILCNRGARRPVRSSRRAPWACAGRSSCSSRLAAPALRASTFWPVSRAFRRHGDQAHGTHPGQKEFVGKRPRTLLSLTARGRLALRRYAKHMGAILGELS